MLPLPFASYTPAPQPHCMTKVPGREDPPGAGWAGGTGGVEGRAGGGSRCHRRRGLRGPGPKGIAVRGRAGCCRQLGGDFCEVSGQPCPSGPREGGTDPARPPLAAFLPQGPQPGAELWQSRGNPANPR